MRRVGWLIVPIVLLALLGVAIFAARAPRPTTAFTLRPGDCFDIPGDAQVADVSVLACDGPHDAEVFVAGDLPTASPGPSALGGPQYPGEGAVGQWVGANCGAAAEQAYVGGGPTSRPDVAVGYFFPSADAWTHGERQVTCYLHAASKLTAPLREAASSAAAS